MRRGGRKSTHHQMSGNAATAPCKTLKWCSIQRKYVEVYKPVYSYDWKNLK